MGQMRLREILREYEVFIVGNPRNFRTLNLEPFGKAVHVIDVKRSGHNVFYDLLHQLDGLSYGKEGIPMEKWVMLDCGIMPSCFVGLARHMEDCPEDVLANFKMPAGYNGLVPISEYCAIPMREQDTFIGHTCATVEHHKGLGLFSKILGLVVYRAAYFEGVAQYLNSAVRTHTCIADLRLETAITEAHSLPNETFIYSHPVHQEQLAELFDAPRQVVEPSFLLDPHDLKRLCSLQQEIERGAHYYVTKPGHVLVDGKILIPIVQR